MAQHQMKLEQAARQALEVLEGIQHGTDWNNGTHAKIYRPKFPEAITALREALAEPDIEEMTLTQIAAKHEQAKQSQLADVERSEDPVAWFTDDYKDDRSATTYDKKVAERWEEEE